MTAHVHDQRLNYLAGCLDIVDRHGWMIQGVFPVAGGPPAPTFCYTVGLSHPSGRHKWDPHPEFITIGVGFDAGKYILNELGEMVRNGRSLTAGEQLTGLVAGDFVLTLVQVADDSSHPLNTVRDLYGKDIAPGVLQVVFPDMEGRFPWDDGYDLDPRVQPLLGPKP